MNLTDSIGQHFIRLFGENPIIVRSPGRINLIGEHTDYNDGYVLPAAIEKALYFACMPSGSKACRIVAHDLNDEHRFTVDQPRPSPKGWPNYILGIVDQLMKAGHSAGGFNCVFGGDIPIGAGLSSSAALGAGCAVALRSMFELSLDDLSLVRLAQRSENEFVGVQCGIMDQYINIFGKNGKVLRIDCRALKHETFSFDHPVAIVLFNTKVSHSLASSEYNARREECARGVAAVQRGHAGVTHLRDVSLEMLEAVRKTVGETIYRRCHFVVEENNRVLAACRALEQSDVAGFGRLLYESHEGLSHDYEVSCPELDALVESVRNLPEVYGGRMMGGGFGGCTINLVKPEAVERVTNTVIGQYRQKFGKDPEVYVTTIGSGTEVVQMGHHAKA